MKKPLELLVVEDKPHHLKDAREFFDERIAIGVNINVDYATTYEEAKQRLEEKRYAGILTDIFFPSRIKGQNKNEILSELEKSSMNEGIAEKYDKLFNDEKPNGVLIVKYAKDNNISVRMITDTYHHGQKTEPINRLHGIIMIDRGLDDPNFKDTQECYNKEWNSKNWKQGYVSLIEEIHKKELPKKTTKMVFEDYDMRQHPKVKKIIEQYFKGLDGYTMRIDF